jgi:hypothetical protein
MDRAARNSKIHPLMMRPFDRLAFSLCVCCEARSTSKGRKFTTLVPPPVETEFPVFIAEPPSAPLDPAPPQCHQAPVASLSSAASRKPGHPRAPAAPAAQPARQSRLWNAGGPAGLAALEARSAAERQAQRPQRLRLQDPSGQLDNEIIFLCEDDEDDANEASPTIQFMSPKDDTDEA